MFQPHKGVENPIIRRAMDLCDDAGMKVIYHEDSVEVWFAPNNKRIYTIWSQFLADAETIFGEKMHERPEADGAQRVAEPLPRAGFGNRPQVMQADLPSGVDRRASGPAADEVAKLRQEIRVLERAIKVVGMQRDEWKREAEALKERLDTVHAENAAMAEARLFQGAGPAVDRYKQARQIIVRRLHPDIPGTDDEKAYRERLFKTIWSEIEVLDRK